MEKIKLIGRYIGAKRITNFRISERKTYLGREITEIEFDDKTKKEYPSEDLEIITTEEAKDKTTLRQIQIAPVAAKILGVLADSELPTYHPEAANIQFLLETVIMESIQQNTRSAYGKLFNKDYYDITLADIDKVLKSDGKKKRKNNN